MPKEKIEVEWYDNFFRFSPAIVDSRVHIYQTKDTNVYYFDTTGVQVALKYSSNLSTATATIFSLLALYSLF